MWFYQVYNENSDAGFQYCFNICKYVEPNEMVVTNINGTWPNQSRYSREISQLIPFIYKPNSLENE